MVLETRPPETAAPNAMPTSMPRAGAGRRFRVWETVLVSGLVLLAAAVRWPDYLYIPVFSDEAYDAVRSALIAQGRLHTPVNSSPYIGSIQNYLTAALFAVLGPQVYVPRLLVLIVGCLTVVAAYLLTREWAGPRAGTLAAALVATNPVHVLVNSHIAWSNSLTPLFTTLGLWQLVRAVRLSDYAALAWCAVLMAVAVLTHPAAIVLLPACAIYLIWKAPRLLRSRWVWISAGLFVAVYSPVIVYYLFSRLYPAQFAEQLRSSHPDPRAFGPGLGTDFDPLQYAVQVRGSHSLGRPMGPELYVENLSGFALLFLRTLPGAIESRAGIPDYLLDPMVLIWLLLMVASLLALARRGNTLPLLVVLCSLAIAPLWTVKRFEPISHGRYLMPTVILAYAALAIFVVQLRPGALRIWYLRAPTVLAFGLAGLLLVLQPLVSLSRFYDGRPADNRSAIEALEAIEAGREPGELVLLDHDLNDRRLGEGAVELDQALGMLLTVRRIPFDYIVAEPDELQSILARKPTQLVVLDRSSVPRLSERFSLNQLALITPRVGRGERQGDPIPSWRDSGLATWLRQLDPRRSPERRDTQACLDCGDHGVYRISAQERRGPG